ncbi:hypothetical protein [Citrobacter werkmanii]|uniref:hypothetical protein n=1 Tax=Citrobacter werkmanii TaxID=67827 RepID=UPI0037C91644
MKTTRRNSPPRSESGRVARENGSEMVMFSSRVEVSLDEYVRLFITTQKVRKQDVLREALLLFKQKHEDA